MQVTALTSPSYVSGTDPGTDRSHRRQGVAGASDSECRARIVGRPGNNDEPHEWRFIERLRALGRNPLPARRAWEQSAKARGLAAARAGRVPEAIRHFEAARAQSPYPDEEIEFNLKELRLIRRLERRLELRPNDLAAVLDLGKAYFAQERAENALACFQRAVKIAPESAEAHSLYALELHYRGQYDACIEGYQTALRLMPGHPRAAMFIQDALQGRPPGDHWQHAQGAPATSPENAIVTTPIPIAPPIAPASFAVASG